MENVIIQDSEKLKKIKEAFAKEGSKSLHIISDFDRTLTYSSINGQRRSSLMAVLRSGDYLTSDYAKKSQALFDKYHPIEIDPNVTLVEKKKAMQEWWQTHFDLLIESKLNKNDLRKIVASREIKFRGGALEFFNSLHSNKIPLIVFTLLV